MTTIELIDWKGEYWRLTAAATQINKKDGLTYINWYIEEGPLFLHTNGAHYDMINTVVFTEWFA